MTNEHTDTLSKEGTCHAGHSLVKKLRNSRNNGK